MTITWLSRAYVGALKGEQLQSVQAYQEFYPSWKIFHPQTEILKN